MSLFRTPIALALAALAVLLGAAVLVACGDSGGDAGKKVASPASDPVVLDVDGRSIRQSVVDAVRAEFRLGGTSDTEARAEKEAVRRELVRREAERLGVTADAAEVAARRAAMVDQLGGEEALAAALKAVPMTDEQLRSGLTDGVLREALQNARFEDLTATTAAARDYYDGHRATFREPGSVHLWSIQVAAERIAENAIDRLESGRPFAEVARQFSADPESKAAGGDLGTVALASLPEPLREAVEGTPAGEVSEPVEGPGGWYVLKATELRRARTAPFPEVREQILSELTRRKRFVALDAWLDSARQAATVTRP
jgi:peptidyl-prolyl cis-trans isomerase C